MNRETTRWMRPMGAVMAAALLLVAAPVTASNSGPGGRVRVVEPLDNAGADDDAQGRTRLVLRTDAEGRFEVSVKHLTPDATFEVIVNDVKVGTLVTTGGGGGRARFRTRPRGRDQLLGFDPRGARVVIRDAAGNDVLTGTVPADSVDPTEVACCLPDDDGEGVECEDRTADECTAAGGTVTASATCLPDPCNAAPPAGGDIVCCLPDDNGAECEDRTQDECAAGGGTVVMAASCDPNPCAATPPVNEVQCCVPEDNGFECEQRTETECAAHGGTSVGAGTCAPDACAALPPPPSADIQCCVTDASSGEAECELRSADDCTARGGVDMGAGTCSPDPCGGSSGGPGPH